MNEKNVKSFKDMSRDENSRIDKMGAKASAKAKRRKKTSKESIELLLSLPASNKNKEKLQENGINSDDADNRMVVVAKLYSEAMKGNIRAIELLLKGFELSEMYKEEIKLNKQYNTAEWFGRGIIENYADRKSGTPIGLYKLPVEDMSFEYDRPQENGNRCDNRFVNMISDNNGGITVFGADTFDFTVHDYSLENLMKAEHFGEIEKSKENYLYIDYKTRGLGNASCGSEPERCHELYPHTFRFVFGIKPYTTTESALDFAQTAFDVRTEKLSDEYIYNPKKMKKQNN